MKKRRSRIPHFRCPICLAEKQAIAVAPDVEGDSKTPPELADEGGDPVFEMAACGHLFCASCLRDYVRSRLLSGEVEIPCCHQVDIMPCGVPMTEAEVSRLVRMDLSGRADDADGAALWAKYQKLKFDRLHGRDVVRRCPKCDEPRLFDARSMKEYRFKFLSQNNDVCTPAPAKTDKKNASGYMGRLERALQTLRGGHPDAETNSSVSDEASGSNDTNPQEGGADEERGNLPKDDGPNNPNPEERVGDIEEGLTPKEDGKSSEDDDLTQPLPVEARSSPGGCDNARPTDIKAGTMGASTDNAEQSKSTLDRSCSDEDGASSGKIVEEGKTTETNDGESSGKSMDDGRTPGTDDGLAQSAATKNPSNTQGSANGGELVKEVRKPNTDDGLAQSSGQSPSLVKSTTPIVTCHACSTEFCYFHSNAHSGKSCVEYHLRSAEIDRSSFEYTTNVLRAKPCPECGIAVAKDGGCNQMRCRSCGTYFCWLCGEVVDSEYEHFRWWNLRGCANMQMDERNEYWRLARCWARSLSVLQIIVLGPPAVMLTLASIPLLCLAQACGATLRERVVNGISFWGSFLSTIFMLPLMVLGMMVLVVLWIVLCAGAFLAKLFKPLLARGGTLRPQPAREGTARPQPTQNGTSSGPGKADSSVEGRSDTTGEVELENPGARPQRPFGVFGSFIQEMVR